VLSDAVVEAVQDLLDDGYSQRAVAEMVRVSRGFVSTVASGKRVASSESQRPTELSSPSGRQVRCPGCGGLVQLPCVACRTRATTTHRTPPGDDVDAAALQLVDGCRARYEAIYCKRFGEIP